MSRRRDFEDDGRTIADMSGLSSGGASEKGSPKGNLWQNKTDRKEREGLEERPWENASFSWKERFYYIGAALGAALLIALVFMAGLGLVIWLVTLYGA